MLLSMLLATAAAHDLGWTPVYVKLSGESYKISISLDPPGDVGDLGPWLIASEASLPHQLELTFGGQRIVGPPELIVRPRAADPFLLQYRGTIPEGAETFGFRSDPGTGPWGLSLYPEGAPVRELLLLGGEARVLGLDGSDRPMPSDPGASGVPGGETVASFERYLGLGLVHIIPRGLDHVLFVLGLCLASVAPRSLLLQISAFTVSHSLTLGAASLGLLVVPSSIVEPLIAASIVIVGIENLTLEPEPRRRTALVFGLGLLHGLGFAGVLGELSVPMGQLLLALLGFNLGVELGQLVVVSVALAALWLLGRHERLRAWSLRAGSLAISVVGLSWLIERLASG